MCACCKPRNTRSIFLLGVERPLFRRNITEAPNPELWVRGTRVRESVSYARDTRNLCSPSAKDILAYSYDERKIKFLMLICLRNDVSALWAECEYYARYQRWILTLNYCHNPLTAFPHEVQSLQGPCYGRNANTMPAKCEYYAREMLSQSSYGFPARRAVPSRTMKVLCSVALQGAALTPSRV